MTRSRMIYLLSCTFFEVVEEDRLIAAVACYFDVQFPSAFRIIEKEMLAECPRVTILRYQVQP